MADKALTRESMRPEARRCLALPGPALRRRIRRTVCLSRLATWLGLLSGAVWVARAWIEPGFQPFAGYWPLASMLLLLAGVLLDRRARQAIEARLVLANERMERLWESGWRRDPDGAYRDFPSLGRPAERD